MPTYSYACTQCGHRFDAQQAFTDTALTECPECEGRLRKLFGNVGVVFKGSGFYRNDARKDGASSGGSGASSGSGGSGTTTSSSSTTSGSGGSTPASTGSSGSSGSSSPASTPAPAPAAKA